MVGGGFGQRVEEVTPCEIPVAHKTIDRNQSSYHSIEIRIPDAPFDDEIVVAVAMTSSVRPQARPYTV